MWNKCISAIVRGVLPGCNLDKGHFLLLNYLISSLSVETGDFLNCEGSGLFLLQSSCECRHLRAFGRGGGNHTIWPVKTHYLHHVLLTYSGNHSCIPNAEAAFPDNNFLLHLSALSDVQPGEVPPRGLWTAFNGPMTCHRVWVWLDVTRAVLKIGLFWQVGVTDS